MDDLAYLLSAAAWQDSLLQSYRTLHLTFQSILLAIGIGLVVAIGAFTGKVPTIVSTGIFVGIFILHFISVRWFKSIVVHRGNDINFWHKAIILAENELPKDERYFTTFKVYQKLHRQDNANLQSRFLTDNRISSEDADLLIEKGLGHTRRVIDQQLFAFISWIWALLLLAVVFIVVFQFFIPH
jgi:hypothetical protein